MLTSLKSKKEHRIPVQLSEFQFNECILKHIPLKLRGAPYKIPLFKMFNYILKLLYMGSAITVCLLEAPSS